MKILFAIIILINLFLIYLVVGPYTHQFSTYEPSGKDIKFMGEAIKMAITSSEKGNAKVGAVIVIDGKVVGRGAPSDRALNKIEYYKHAETVAIDEAIKKYGHIEFRKKKTSLYTTFQPCSMCRGMSEYFDIDKVFVLEKRSPQKIFNEFSRYREILLKENYFSIKN